MTQRDYFCICIFESIRCFFFRKILPVMPLTVSGTQEPSSSFIPNVPPLVVALPRRELRHQYTPSEVLVRWSNSVRPPPPPTRFQWSSLGSLCPTISVTFWNRQSDIHTTSCRYGPSVRWESNQGLTSLSSSLFSFFTQLFLSLCMWLTKCNIMKAFQESLSERTLSPPCLNDTASTPPLWWPLTAINTFAFCRAWTRWRTNQFFSCISWPLGWSLQYRMLLTCQTQAWIIQHSFKHRLPLNNKLPSPLYSYVTCCRRHFFCLTVPTWALPRPLPKVHVNS